MLSDKNSNIFVNFFTVDKLVDCIIIIDLCMVYIINCIDENILFNL